MIRALLFTLCLAGVAQVPEWVQGPPSVPGRVYAVGRGQTPEQALDDARFELLASLRLSYQGEQLVTQERTFQGKEAHGRDDLRSSSRVSVSVQDLPGIVVERRAPGYVLIYLDVPVAAQEIRTRLLALRSRMIQLAPWEFPAMVLLARDIQAQAPTAALLRAAGEPGPGIELDALDREAFNRRSKYRLGISTDLGPLVQAGLREGAEALGLLTGVSENVLWAGGHLRYLDAGDGMVCAVLNLRLELRRGRVSFLSREHVLKGFGDDHEGASRNLSLSISRDLPGMVMRLLDPGISPSTNEKSMKFE